VILLRKGVGLVLAGALISVLLVTGFSQGLKSAVVALPGVGVPVPTYTVCPDLGLQWSLNPCADAANPDAKCDGVGDDGTLQGCEASFEGVDEYHEIHALILYYGGPQNHGPYETNGDDRVIEVHKTGTGVHFHIEWNIGYVTGVGSCQSWWNGSWHATGVIGQLSHDVVTDDATGGTCQSYPNGYYGAGAEYE
jgi:hypothetical protein